MTVSQIRGRVFERLGESTSAPVFYSAAHVLEAVNAAQRLFVLLSLCLEAKASLTLAANQVTERLLTVFPDFIVALRVQTSTSGKVRPASVEGFAARDDSWRLARAAVPTAYVVHGFDFAMFYPAPSAGCVLSLTYARGPATLSADGDVPGIPEEYHQDLADAAIVILRMKEGGQEFAKEMPRWKSFLSAAGQCADSVRKRNRLAGYDREPAEREDESRKV